METATCAQVDPSLYLARGDAGAAETRAVLVEWMLEVCHVWTDVDGATTFHAVRILDAALAALPSPPKNLLQLLGVCCLRVAMGRKSSPAAPQQAQAQEQAQPSEPQSHGPAEAGPDPLAPARFVDICAGIYLEADVERMTALIWNTLNGGTPSTAGPADSSSAPGPAPVPGPEAGPGAPAAAADGVTPPPANSAASFAATAAASGCCGCSDGGGEGGSAAATAAESRARAARLLSAPTARHFLRALWAAEAEALAEARTTAAHRAESKPHAQDTAASGHAASAAAAHGPGPAKARPPSAVPEMQLASFLLQLALLRPTLSAAPPAQLAAAAVAAARGVLGREPWPERLQRVIPLAPCDPLLVRLAGELLEAQESLEAHHFRALFASSVEAEAAAALLGLEQGPDPSAGAGESVGEGGSGEEGAVETGEGAGEAQQRVRRMEALEAWEHVMACVSCMGPLKRGERGAVRGG
ncbi:hypothetical protein HYH03_001585 [Edaphochlamys debaryana]|uniref:Cyclin C-terminal domain-containing protein n=1 Tax=Edaphochlamys debaryana TaxID=47281 RepID=A0A835YDQ5_9CHLO|nr:hypothetical protein HYH03_001585 [Edaphochlamys debaryana]|eukprot:KAG2500823.1 hypothetical protein HYH03_001585 [Edaphochlamys debaryana]